MWRRLKKFVSDDSMSIALFALFLVCVIGQAVSGWLAYDDWLQAAHFQEIAFRAYLATGNFLDGMFSNWQAAILQLGVLIAFGTVLRQKGAAHSRKDAPSMAVYWKFSSATDLARVALCQLVVSGVHGDVCGHVRIARFVRALEIQ